MEEELHREPQPAKRNKTSPLREFVKGYKEKVETAQIDNFRIMEAAIERYGSLEAARKAEPELFIKGGVLSIVAGHPGKAPK